MRKFTFTAAAVCTLFMISCVSTQQTGLAKKRQKRQPQTNDSNDQVWQWQRNKMFQANRERRALELEEADLKHQEQIAYEKLPPKRRIRKQIKTPPFDFH